ncbi:MAG: hypothetical protein R3B84_11530 [Zavarzinella sp.]
MSFRKLLFLPPLLLVGIIFSASDHTDMVGQQPKKAKAKGKTTLPPSMTTGEFAPFGIYEQTAPRAKTVAPMVTQLPLDFPVGARIGLIGNTLFERAQEYGHLEALLQQRFPTHRLVVRNLAWSADEIGIQPLPRTLPIPNST